MPMGTLGKKLSEETKQKISDSLKRKWAEAKREHEAQAKVEPHRVYSNEDNKSSPPE